MINIKTHLDRINGLIKSFKGGKIAQNSILPNSDSDFFQQSNVTALAANVTLVNTLLFENDTYATFQGDVKHNYARTINAFVTVYTNRHHEVLSDPEGTTAGEILLGMVNNGTLIDMRVSGGGLKRKYVEEQSNINPWIGSFADIGRYDGLPTGIGTISVVELPTSILSTYSEQDILKIVRKYMAAGIEPVIKFFDFNEDGFSLDPSDLQVPPVEHFSPASWYFDGIFKWRDSLEITREWSSIETGSTTLINQNGLNAQEATVVAYGGPSQPKPLSSILPTDTWITMYIVTRWDGGISDTAYEIIAEEANNKIQLRTTGTDQLQLVHVCNTSQTLTLTSSNNAIKSGWQVWAWRMKNVTGDGILSWHNRQDAPQTIENPSWTAMRTDGGIGSDNNLFSNLAKTEFWDGAFGELILFKNWHSDKTIRRVNKFLEEKWAI